MWKIKQEMIVNINFYLTTCLNIEMSGVLVCHCCGVRKLRTIKMTTKRSLLHQMIIDHDNSEIGDDDVN